MRLAGGAHSARRCRRGTGALREESGAQDDVIIDGGERRAAAEALRSAVRAPAKPLAMTDWRTAALLEGA